MEKTIKPLTLEINEDLWTTFKNKVPRTITLNDKVVDLIKREVENKQVLLTEPLWDELEELRIMLNHKSQEETIKYLIYDYEQSKSPEVENGNPSI